MKDEILASAPELSGRPQASGSVEGGLLGTGRLGRPPGGRPGTWRGPGGSMGRAVPFLVGIGGGQRGRGRMWDLGHHGCLGSLGWRIPGQGHFPVFSSKGGRQWKLGLEDTGLSPTPTPVSVPPLSSSGLWSLGAGRRQRMGWLGPAFPRVETRLGPNPRPHFFPPSCLPSLPCPKVVKQVLRRSPGPGWGMGAVDQKPMVSLLHRLLPVSLQGLSG